MQEVNHFTHGRSCKCIIPNVFSPNNDGENDDFGIFISSKFSGNFLSLKIYDRWGNLVFTTKKFDNLQKLWDGNFNGKPFEQGVYTYMVEYAVEGKDVKVVSGDVTVVR